MTSPFNIKTLADNRTPDAIAKELLLSAATFEEKLGCHYISGSQGVDFVRVCLKKNSFDVQNATPIIVGALKSMIQQDRPEFENLAILVALIALPYLNNSVRSEISTIGKKELFQRLQTLLPKFVIKDEKDLLFAKSVADCFDELAIQEPSDKKMDAGEMSSSYKGCAASLRTTIDQAPKRLLALLKKQKPFINLDLYQGLITPNSYRKTVGKSSEILEKMRELQQEIWDLEIPAIDDERAWRKMIGCQLRMFDIEEKLISYMEYDFGQLEQVAGIEATYSDTLINERPAIRKNAQDQLEDINGFEKKLSQSLSASSLTKDSLSSLWTEYDNLGLQTPVQDYFAAMRELKEKEELASWTSLSFWMSPFVGFANWVGSFWNSGKTRSACDTLVDDIDSSIYRQKYYLTKTILDFDKSKLEARKKERVGIRDELEASLSVPQEQSSKEPSLKSETSPKPVDQLVIAKPQPATSSIWSYLGSFFSIFGQASSSSVAPVEKVDTPSPSGPSLARRAKSD